MIFDVEVWHVASIIYNVESKQKINRNAKNAGSHATAHKLSDEDPAATNIRKFILLVFVLSISSQQEAGYIFRICQCFYHHYFCKTPQRQMRYNIPTKYQEIRNHRNKICYVSKMKKDYSCCGLRHNNLFVRSNILKQLQERACQLVLLEIPLN